MEKIYLEKNKGNKKKKNNMTKSVLLSCILSIIAIAGILSTTFNTTYAIPTIAGLPDSFIGDQIAEQTATGKSTTGGVFLINTYRTDSGEIVYCLERDVAFGDGSTYNKGGEITDYGLLYLMANVFPHQKFVDASGNLLPDEVQVWLSQATIWQYLYETNALNNDDDITANLALLPTITEIEYGASVPVGNPQPTVVLASGTNVYDLYVKPLVDAALANKTAPTQSLNVAIDSGDVSLTADGLYYQTGLITVTGSPADNFNNYSINLTAPEGSIIIDENGNELTSLTGLSPTTKFHVRIPVDKVTEENKNVNVTINGSYTSYKGNYYISTGAQTISSVYTEDNIVQKGLDIPVNLKIEVPDTGLSGSATLYFLGIAILIIGLGVIYVNVRPNKA